MQKKEEMYLRLEEGAARRKQLLEERARSAQVNAD